MSSALRESEDEVVEVQACDDCGKMVPLMNMTIHRLHACGGRKRPARSRSEERTSASVTPTPMDPDNPDNDDERPPPVAPHNNDAESNTGTASLPRDEGATINIDNFEDAIDISDETHGPVPPLMEMHSLLTAGDRNSVDRFPEPSSQRPSVAALPSMAIETTQARNGNPTPGATARSTPPGSPWDSLSSSLVSSLQRLTRPVTRLSATLSPEPKRSRQSRRSSTDSVLQVGEFVDLVDGDAATETAESEGWACPRCTLINESTRSTCEACQGRRTNHGGTNQAAVTEDVRAADPTVRERLVDDFTSSPNTSSSRNSATPYVSGGAIIGGVLGAAGAYIRGRPIGSGALEGAVSGAMSAAIMDEVMRESRSEEYNELRRASSQRARATQQALQQHHRQLRQRQHLQQPSGVQIIRRQGPNGTIMTVVRNNGAVDPAIMMNVMMAQLAQQERGQSIQGSRNLDGMTYEQLLQAFGNGTENLGASEGDIQSLPATQIQDVNALPKDVRECAICLESFTEGDVRKTLPCLHGFHQECVDKWLRTNGACPICKHRLSE